MILLRKLSKSSTFKRVSPFVSEDHLRSLKIHTLLETSDCRYLQQRFWSFRGICGQEGSFTKCFFQNSLKDQNLQPEAQCCLALAGTRAFCTDNPQKDLKPVHWSPRIVSEAQAALMDYLHSTAGLDFLDAEHMSKNSPIFLHKLLEKTKKEEEIGRAVSRFLRYHPINEFEPFFESMGLQPSEYGPFLARDLMYLHDSLELLENYHDLCNYGFARTKIGDIYKEATEVFGYESGVLHSKLLALEELGLSKTTVSKIVSSNPTLLISDNVNREFLKVLEELDDMGIERDWIAESLSKNGFCGWGRMLVVINFFLSMGFSKTELGNSIRKHPDFLLNGQTVFLLVGWLLKIGATRKDIYSLLGKFPPVQVGKFLEKLRLGLLFLIEIEMDTEGIREILCMHTEFLGLHILMKPNSLLTYLSTGRKRLRNLIKQDPEMLKKFVMGSKVSRLQRACGGEISIKQKKEFLLHLGFVEGSREMQKALSVFRGKGDELQGRFDFLVRCGLDQNDVCEMIKAAPHILNQKVDVLEKKINFLVHNLGFPISSLVAFPSYMSFTVERVKLRFLMYNWLKDRGKAKPSLALSSVLACSDKVFTKLFISHHPQGLEVWEDFKKTVYRQFVIDLPCDLQSGRHCGILIFLLTTSMNRIQMPETFVVHFGNSKELMEVAEDSVAIWVLWEHVRESLGVRTEDLLFAIINSVSCGKGQDLFLHAFSESLQLIKQQMLQVPSMHPVGVGSDMNAQTKFETELRDFVSKKGLQDHVHFVNKTLSVAPYLAAIDVLIQNSQARGECFGRITIEASNGISIPSTGDRCWWHDRDCCGWIDRSVASCRQGGCRLACKEHCKSCYPCRVKTGNGKKRLLEVHGIRHGR